MVYSDRVIVARTDLGFELEAAAIDALEKEIDFLSVLYGVENPSVIELRITYRVQRSDMEDCMFYKSLYLFSLLCCVIG